jgi:hypothetical protein
MASKLLVSAVAVSSAHAVAPVQSMAIKLRSSMRLTFKTVPLLLFFDPILPGGAGGGNDIGGLGQILIASIDRTWRSKGGPSNACNTRAV